MKNDFPQRNLIVRVSELEDVVDTIKPSDNIDDFREVQQLKAKIRDQEIKMQVQGKTK